jgi:CPA2 family monovalent cation:H+ antiporter-2
VVTLQIATVLAVGAPLLAVTQPFLPPFRGAVALLIVIAVLAVAFWRSAANLQGHVRAGAQVIVEALAAQSKRRHTGEISLEAVGKLLPGLGTPVPIHIEESCPVIGRTLAQVNLRGATGATVLAITRGEQGLIVPGPEETLRAGDMLALTGSHDAIATALALLSGKAPESAAEDAAGGGRNMERSKAPSGSV